MLSAIPLPCGLYARSDQDETVTQQLDQGRKFLEHLDDPDLRLIAQYCDSQENGTSMNHQGLNQLRADAEVGWVRVVVVTSLSRFTRSAIQLSKFIMEMTTLGVAVVSINDRTCTDAAMHDRFFRTPTK